MLTTLDKVKIRLAITDGLQDALLTQILTGVSARFDRETDRKLERTVDYTEILPADSTLLVLGCTPVEAITKIEVRTMDDADWVEKTPRMGIMGFSMLHLAEVLGDATARLRVTYTGGYVCPPGVPGAGQVALPAELEWAAIEQTAMCHQLRASAGIYRVEVSGGTYIEIADKEWVPFVRSILRKYRRLVVA